MTGRVTFDDAEAWGGVDPMGIPSFIVTHEVEGRLFCDHPTSQGQVVPDATGAGTGLS